jgi:hypothetical protein
LRQLVAAGDVVVVDVGLDDETDLHPGHGDDAIEAVQVALRIDDDGEPPVVRDVAAVAELEGGENLDVDRHAAFSSWWVRTCCGSSH